MFDIITVFCCCCCCFCYCLFVCLVCVFWGLGVLFSFLSSNGAGFCCCLFACLLFVRFSIVLPTFHDVLCNLNLLRRGGEWYDQAVGNINQNIHDWHSKRRHGKHVLQKEHPLYSLQTHLFGVFLIKGHHHNVYSLNGIFIDTCFFMRSKVGYSL